jgi:hypothetical protein
VARRLDLLKILLMLCVVFTHAARGIATHDAVETPLCQVFMLLFAYNVSMVAAHLFFCVSGFLLFQNYDLSFAGYWSCLKKRFRTIFIPYVIFNLYLLLIVNMVKIPGYYVHPGNIDQVGFFNLLFGVTVPPVNYPLWFLGDLMVLILISPFFPLIYKYLGFWGVPAIFACWIAFPELPLHLEFRGPFFFYLGCWLAKSRFELRGLDKYRWPIWAAYGLLLAVNVWLDYHSGLNPERFPLVYRLSLIFGVASFWCLTGLDWVRDNWLLGILCPFSFFIYLTHEPILSLAIAFSRFLVSADNGLAQIGYVLLMFGVTVVVTYGLGLGLKKGLPPVYSALTGAR